jgi:hypothetical protein
MFHHTHYTMIEKIYYLPVSQQRYRDVTAQNGYEDISFFKLYLHKNGTYVFIAFNPYVVIC